MKTKIFKVFYESKEMPLVAIKLSDNTEEEKKLLKECAVKADMVLVNLLEQTPYRQEDGFMFMIAKTFIGGNFDSLQSGQDIELAIEMKRIKSCYNCENFNREDDWCKKYNDYPQDNFYEESNCKDFRGVKE
jgi:hypothetical protein